MWIRSWKDLARRARRRSKSLRRRSEQGASDGTHTRAKHLDNFGQSSCVILHDSCKATISAHSVKYVATIDIRCISRGASRRGPSVPNFLSRRDLAWSRAVLHGCDEGHINRRRPWDRWNSRVSTLYSRSRSSCYFGASEATIFSKCGSPRIKSQ